MAGIGFALKKLFAEESLANRIKAYVFSAVAAAGPWIITVITINIFVIISRHYFYADVFQRQLFMGAVVYSFVFSYILTSPWQMLLTRYVADKLYKGDFSFINPSFSGAAKLLVLQNTCIFLAYFYNKQLPIYFKMVCLMLFIVVSMIWLLMVYAGLLKDYIMIFKAYAYGSGVSVVLALLLMHYPLNLADYPSAANLLIAYLAGMSITMFLLMHGFLKVFTKGNGREFDFLRSLNEYPELFFIGLFYTLGLWVDDILMWFGPLGINVKETYQFAPLYDTAVFFAYLTVIPTMIFFLVSIETEFYEIYKKYFGMASGRATYQEINTAGKNMKQSLLRQLIYTMEIQTVITLTLIVLAGKIFAYLGLPIIVKEVFRICALGALCNIFVMLLLLILLYLEARLTALFISILFMVSNLAFTLYFIPMGEEFYGFGYFVGSFVTLVVSVFILVYLLNNIDYYTFARQPFFQRPSRGVFVKLADCLNNKAEVKRAKYL